MRTHNGGAASVATEFDYASTTREVRQRILEREAKDKERRKAYRRKTPAAHKPGPITWITF